MARKGCGWLYVPADAREQYPPRGAFRRDSDGQVVDRPGRYYYNPTDTPEPLPVGSNPPIQVTGVEPRESLGDEPTRRMAGAGRFFRAMVGEDAFPVNVDEDHPSERVRQLDSAMVDVRRLTVRWLYDRIDPNAPRPSADTRVRGAPAGDFYAHTPPCNWQHGVALAPKRSRSPIWCSKRDVEEALGDEAVESMRVAAIQIDGMVNRWGDAVPTRTVEACERGSLARRLAEQDAEEQA